MSLYIHTCTHTFYMPTLCQILGIPSRTFTIPFPECSLTSSVEGPEVSEKNVLLLKRFELQKIHIF